jgi:hypothetical protein
MLGHIRAFRLQLTDAGGRRSGFHRGAANGRNRRHLVIAARSGQGRFTQPTAAFQTWRPELVFMPSKATFREAAMPAWPDIDMRHARACGSANRDAPLRMSRIPERVDGTRQTCEGSHIRQTSRGGGTRNVDPDHIGGTGVTGRSLIPLLAKRGEEIACMDIRRRR